MTASELQRRVEHIQSAHEHVIRNDPVYVEQPADDEPVGPAHGVAPEDGFLGGPNDRSYNTHSFIL